MSSPASGMEPMNYQEVLRGPAIKTIQILVWPAFLSAVSHFMSRADAAAIVEKEWRLIDVHQNNVARTSVRQHQLDGNRNRLFRLRYSIPPKPIPNVHCVLNTRNIERCRRDSRAEKSVTPLDSGRSKIERVRTPQDIPRTVY